VATARRRAAPARFSLSFSAAVCCLATCRRRGWRHHYALFQPFRPPARGASASLISRRRCAGKPVLAGNREVSGPLADGFGWTPQGDPRLPAPRHCGPAGAMRELWFARRLFPLVAERFGPAFWPAVQSAGRGCGPGGVGMCGIAGLLSNSQASARTGGGLRQPWPPRPDDAGPLDENGTTPGSPARQSRTSTRAGHPAMPPPAAARAWVQRRRIYNQRRVRADLERQGTLRSGPATRRCCCSCHPLCSAAWPAAPA